MCIKSELTLNYFFNFTLIGLEQLEKTYGKVVLICQGQGQGFTVRFQ